MQNVQDVFNRIQEKKQEQKNIRAQYKDAINASTEYKDITQKLQGYKLRKKQIEDEIKAELGSQYERLESIKKDMDNDRELLTDLAINTLMEGKTLEITDSDGNAYEPVFKVSFKKTNVVSPSEQ